MCSLGEEDDLEKTQTTLPFNLHRNKWNQCNKCKTSQPVVLLRRKDVYCKECFLNGTVHKFKAFIGKHRLVKPNENVLVWVKHGHPSISLLNLLRSGLDLQTPKKLHFKPIIIYIAKCNHELNTLEKISAIISSFNFATYFTSLYQYVCNSADLDKILFKSPQELIGICNNELPKSKNSTVSESLESVYEKRLLTDVAKYLNCSAVFIPDVDSDVATDILTNISLGRGAYLSLDTGIFDNRDPKVTLIRPLRHFDKKELAFYNVYTQQEPIVEPIKMENHKDNSVHYLIQKFVSNLQLNFPATVTTVLRTGDKLTVDKNMKENEICGLCRAPLETSNTEELNSETATNFSRWISAELQTFKKNMEYSEFENTRYNSFCYACSKIAGYIEKDDTIKFKL